MQVMQIQCKCHVSLISQYSFHVVCTSRFLFGLVVLSSFKGIKSSWYFQRVYIRVMSSLNFMYEIKPDRPIRFMFLFSQQCPVNAPRCLCSSIRFFMGFFRGMQNKTSGICISGIPDLITFKPSTNIILFSPFKRTLSLTKSYNIYFISISIFVIHSYLRNIPLQ